MVIIFDSISSQRYAFVSLTLLSRSIKINMPKERFRLILDPRETLSSLTVAVNFSKAAVVCGILDSSSNTIVSRSFIDIAVAALKKNPSERNFFKQATEHDRCLITTIIITLYFYLFISYKDLLQHLQNRRKVYPIDSVAY